jgi:hypothetical protein
MPNAHGFRFQIAAIPGHGEHSSLHRMAELRSRSSSDISIAEASAEAAAMALAGTTLAAQEPKP